MTDKTYLGKPCKHGHDGTRYKSNSICVKCHKKYAHVCKNWIEKNKERHLSNSQEWYKNHKEQKRQKQKDWNKANPDKLRVHYQNRKSRVGNQRINEKDIKFIFSLQKGCCAICRTTLDSYEIDHIKPLSLGGKHEKDNIQILCRSCNRVKHAKDPIIFMQSKGYLL